MPAKEPNSRKDYGFDYSADLGADTIAASTWTADAGLTLTGATFDAKTTTVWIEGGAEGQNLTATNRVTTAAGRVHEHVLTLLIRAGVDPDDDYLVIASDIVRELAPVPSGPVPPDYPPRAARAERLLLNWLTQTKGGTLTSKGSVAGVTASKGFARMPEVRGIVAAAMGDYYRGGVTANKGYVETFR